jgi:hypothetical protein
MGKRHKFVQRALVSLFPSGRLTIIISGLQCLLQDIATMKFQFPHLPSDRVAGQLITG